MINQIKPLNMVLGADIGGSHITTAMVNLNTRKVLKDTWCRINVNAHGEADEIICRWVESIRKTIDKANMPVSAYGIAMPGPFDYEAGIAKIRNADKFDALFGLNIKQLIANRLGIDGAQIRFENDAGCFLKGEVFSGAAIGFQHVIAVTLGTGLGTARYHHGVADDANLWCIPFKGSIAEEYISTRWFVNRYKELTGECVNNVKALAEMYELDNAVRKVFDEFGRNLALFLNEFIAIDSPESIIIGGNIAHSYKFFEKELRTHLGQHNKHIPIHLSILNEEAALIGAASTWSYPVQVSV